MGDVAGAEQAAVDMQAILTEREIPEDGRALDVYKRQNYDSYEAPEEIGSLKENSVVSVRGTVTAGVYVNLSLIHISLRL